MPIGLVKWWNDNQGYGFISQSTGPDVFVHYSNVQNLEFPTLSEGHTVEFEIDPNPRGPRALHVRTPGQPIQSVSRPSFMVSTQVKVFHAQSTRELEYEINSWAEETGWRIVSASLTAGIEEGWVSAIVVLTTE